MLFQLKHTLPVVLDMCIMSEEKFIVYTCHVYTIKCTQFVLQVTLPELITKRGSHTVSTFQLAPHCVWLVVFGGQRQVGATVIACTAIVELGEHHKYSNVVLCVHAVVSYSSFGERWTLTLVVHRCTAN